MELMSALTAPDVQQCNHLYTGREVGRVEGRKGGREGGEQMVKMWNHGSRRAINNHIGMNYLLAAVSNGLSEDSTTSSASCKRIYH